VTTPVDGTSYTPITNYPAAASSAAPVAKDQFGQDTFLKLLVAQLRYQDPMNPAEGTEFMSQTAQFTSLEKLTAVADLQGELLAAQRLLGASNMVGRTVSFLDENGSGVNGVVTAARIGTDGPVLRVGDKDVPMASVTEVSATPATPVS
jgi:flagellar basal-body rod modification protein FlgD